MKSKPGLGFTAAVLIAITSIATLASVARKAEAAALGTGVVKTGSLFKLATVIALLAAFSGVISSFFGLRANLDQSRTQRGAFKQ